MSNINIEMKSINMKTVLKLLLVFIMHFFANAGFAQLPAGESLLPDGLNAFTVFGPAAAKTMVEQVPVEGQSFTKAFRINTFGKTGDGNYGLQANIKTALHKWDVLWVSFKARSLESKRETGESLIEVRFDQLVNGKYEWPSHLERGISIGNNWTEISIPFLLRKDVQPENARFVIQFDTYVQRFEIGPVNFFNYGQNVKLSDLPKTVVHYEGDAPDAPWRKAAAERIEKYRKGNLSIKVIDQNGKPVKGATVSVQLKKNAYSFGTATNSDMLLDSNDQNKKTYRDTLLKYFNKIVFENEVKSGNWAKVNHNKTIQAVQWLHQYNIDARGHVMVWPSWQHSPHLRPFQKDSAALRAEILRLINDETTVLKGQFKEWDVVNEPFAHHNIMDSLGGKKVMLEWFAAAHKNAPEVKLFLNEYTMFHAQGKGSDDFYNNVKFLLDNKAPIEGIGEQSHIGGTPPGIPFILQRLDHFATFKLPIQISEFDITSDDEDFKARYLRDYFTAVFSHPITTGILQWGFWEGSHWMPAAALWDWKWNIRPAGIAFTELVSKTWSTNVNGTTGKDGVYSVRGFNGVYEIMVTYKGKTSLQKVSLDSKGKTITVKL
jgi:GH35 family endo-1,4-beta-xylanase